MPLRQLVLMLFTLLAFQPLLAKSPTTIKVITHNVWYGFTKKSEPRHANWRKWMNSEQPDVVALQELNTYTDEKLASDAKSWGHSYSVLLKEDGFATGITSRFPITDVARIREGMHHGLLRCRIEGIWFYVIHFHPSDYVRRVEEATLLAKDIEQLGEQNPRIVLAGDFNGFSPVDREHYASDPKLVPFFQMLDQRNPNSRNLNNGQMDYEGIEAILKQGFMDLVARFRSPDDSFVGTFPTRLVSDEDHGTDRRLDYIFVSPNLTSQVQSAKILRDDITELLSDHIPVTATISLRSEDTNLPEIPTKDANVFIGQPKLVQEHGAGEGPAWHPELGLMTSGDGNINLRNKQGIRSVYRISAGSNGLIFDRTGRLIICEPVRRRVTRIQADGKTTVLAETFSGMKFNQPNDLTIDSKNRIYFSDPNYGDRSAMELVDEAGKHVEGIYRIDVDGKVTRIITHEVDRPNGLVVTQDDQFLYVADNNNSAGGARKLWRFRLTAEGNVDASTRKMIYDWGTTRGPDGMKLDSLGRLYVAAGLNRPNPPHETADNPTAGVYVFSPAGDLLDFVNIPRDETTNCAFGDNDLKTLYITAGGTLWSIRTSTSGKPPWP
ncbi:MAG TPA: hypothetical protein DDZ51_19885 [Planctomycetaceae bacterium]|nr:hypothetical protein [Planctomycetaceae bacterium]